MLDNPPLVRVWHGALAVVIAAALIAQLIVTLDKDRSVVNLFSYFTIQSNILVMVAAALVAVRPERGGAVFESVRMAGLVGITVTGVVYAAVLAGNGEFHGLEAWLDFAFHRFAPAVAVLGFLLLRPRTPLGPRSWWFLVWPIAWLIYTLARAEISSPTFQITTTETAPVPYGFLDVDEHGALSVAIVSVVITAFALVLAAFYRWVASSPRLSATTSNT